MTGFGNSLRTVVLLSLLTVMVMLFGRMLGGQGGMLIAFVLAAGMNFAAYWFSDKVVLAMYGAREAGPAEQPELHRLVDDLARRAGLPKPRLFVIPQDSPNAFATGRNPQHAALGVTEGILRLLNRDELEGVLSHELAHVKNRDILVSSIAATMAGVIMYLADFVRYSAIFGGMRSQDEEGGGGALGMLAASIVAPLAAILVQMAVSRSREYLADGTGARIAGQPFGLAGALEKLTQAARAVPLHGSPATSHLFIVNPLSGRSLMSLFSTHPPLEERIRRLRARDY